MPRKSRTELALIPHLRDHHRRISPPVGMSPEETALFKEIVEAAPAMHFCQSDAPLLRSRHSLLVGIRSRDGKPERDQRLAAMHQDGRHAGLQAAADGAGSG